MSYANPSGEPFNILVTNENASHQLRFHSFNIQPSLYPELSLFWVCSMWGKICLHSCLQVLSRLPILIVWLSKQPGKVFIITLRQKILYTCPSKALQLLRPSDMHSHQSSSYDRQVFIITMLSEATLIMFVMLVMIMSIGEPQIRSQRRPQPCLNPWQPCR